MAASLLQSLMDGVSPQALSTIASRLGESEQSTSKGLTMALATVLAGLIGKSADGGAFQKIFELVTDRSNADAVLDDPVALLGAKPAASDLGSRFLGSVFGGNQSAVGDLLSRSAGVKPSTASSLLHMAAPLVLGFLGKNVRAGGLDASRLMSMLLAQRDSILRAAPAGLGSLIGLPDVKREPVRAAYADSASRSESIPINRGTPKWLWPALAAVGLIGVLWLYSRRDAPAIVTTTADSVLSSAGTAVDSIGANVREAATGLGAFVTRRLPSGLDLRIPERGVEARLVDFIEDDSRPVSDTVWFDFDRLQFATGSATLTPESQEQLRNVSEVLRAYPNVKVKIGGYTDNTGDPAANLTLSQNRATSVTQELVRLGTAANRLEAEGYGEQHPVADNSTEAGRQQNRRISIRVTEK